METKEMKLAIIKATLGQLLDIVDPEELVEEYDQINNEIEQLKNANKWPKTEDNV